MTSCALTPHLAVYNRFRILKTVAKYNAFDVFIIKTSIKVGTEIKYIRKTLIKDRQKYV